MNKSRFFRRPVLGWCSLALICACSFQPGFAQEWTRFRGSNGSGIASPGNRIPIQWNTGSYQWKIPISGDGHSSPVLWGHKLFLSVPEKNGASQVLMGVDAHSGQILWRQAFDAQAYAIHNFNSLTSPTPAATADKVFFTWGTPENIELAALNHDGHILWKRNLGPYRSQHGYANSPIVEADKVIIAMDHLGESYLAAYDVNTGAETWKLLRNSSTASAYSTPCLFEPPAGNAYLVFNSSSHGITAVDLETGSLVWEKSDVFDKRSVSSPVFNQNLIFGSCGSGAGGNYVVAISPPDSGRRDSLPEEKFRFRRSAPYVPTPLIRGDRAYFWSDQGIVTCVNLQSGDTLFSERTEKRFFGSPVLVGDHLFAISTDGHVLVVKAADEFEILASNPLGAGTHSTPAVANNRMYLRTTRHLICIGD